MLRIWQSNQLNQLRPNLWDGAAFVLVVVIFSFLAFGATQMAAPYQLGQALPMHLEAKYLPYYALRTVLRMMIAMLLSLAFTFTIGTLAAKNKHAERIIIPIIDILQSVPILGFLSITIVAFIMIFPNSLLGPECSAIFVIFTSQVWNIILGFYQSLKTVPDELIEASRVFHLSKWQHFWRIEVPFAIPSLVWNMMLSMSASWFFVVQSEAISVNHQSILLPGIGSYIALATSQANMHAVALAILAMFIVILLYDQLLFRPLVQWSERFKFDSNIEEKRRDCLLIMLLSRARFLHFIGIGIQQLVNYLSNLPIGGQSEFPRIKARRTYFDLAKISIWTYYSIILIGCFVAVYALGMFIFKSFTISDFLHVILLGVFTAIRVLVLILICSLVWVPIGVWIGMKPSLRAVVQPIAQFLASFPANLLFPVAVILIVKYHLNVEIWTTPLMILGTQWYILFNVIAGAANLPKELYLMTKNFRVSGWVWWRSFILPGIFPFYVTGAMTAAGGAWNASIVAEVVSWGNHTLQATGLGAYIAHYTATGQFPEIVLGISIMCLFVLVINRLLWQPLYHLAQKRFQLN